MVLTVAAKAVLKENVKNIHLRFVKDNQATLKLLDSDYSCKSYNCARIQKAASTSDNIQGHHAMIKQYRKWHCQGINKNGLKESNLWSEPIIPLPA